MELQMDATFENHRQILEDKKFFQLAVYMYLHFFKQCTPIPDIITPV